MCGPCGASGTAWKLAAFISGLDPSDKPGLTEWLRNQELLKSHSQIISRQKRTPVAIYEYRSLDGTPLARKLRFEPGRDGAKKDFLWERWEKGKWVPGLGSVEPLLYRLPEIKNEPFVILVEGEKDADRGAALGLATSTSGNCNSWRPAYGDILTGKKVVVIADADEPGRKHARRTAESLHGKVESLKVLELPGSMDLAEWLEGGGSQNALLDLIHTQPEWQPQVINGAELLNQVCKFVRRFSVLSEAESAVIALWVIHTHAIDAAESTPYLAITSAEKQCGKSRLLEVLQTLVAEPWFTGRVTAAVLVRKVDAKRPTLLLDESDAAFGSEKEYAEALRGILNTGHRRGDDSIGVRLLADIALVLQNSGDDKIFSGPLVDALIAIETSPWGEWSKGKPLTKHILSKLLRPFGIRPQSVRIGDKTLKGYYLSAFEDAFRRYLRPTAIHRDEAYESSQPSQTTSRGGFEACQNVTN